MRKLITKLNIFWFTKGGPWADNRQVKRLTQTTDAAGGLATVVYDAASNVIATVDPLGNRTTLSYDPVNRVSSVKDALSNVTTVPMMP